MCGSGAGAEGARAGRCGQDEGTVPAGPVGMEQRGGRRGGEWSPVTGKTGNALRVIEVSVLSANEGSNKYEKENVCVRLELEILM